MLKHFESVHFIGVGGIGMSALARILLHKGIQVSGSDLKSNDLTEKLRKQGARIYQHHAEEHLPAGTDYVVVSTAISEDNPEIKAARARHIPVIHRSEILNYLMQTSRGIAVTGTHGKTTTSALMSMVLETAEMDPTIVIGGEVPQLGTNAKPGNGEFTVAEVDESDQSLRHLTSEAAIVTNLEVDHLDHYSNLEEIIEAVCEFIENQPEEGKVFVNIDDIGSRKLILTLPESRQRNCITFGVDSADAFYQAKNIALSTRSSQFELYFHGALLGKFEIGIPGLHNVYNALSVAVCAHHLGVDLAVIQTALRQYQGVKRRFQLIGEIQGVAVVDDYGHHPSEVIASLKTAKLQNRPLTVVFQPHRYSRTQAFLTEFSKAFSLADRIVFLPIYAASEKPEDFSVSIDALRDLTQQENPSKDVLLFDDFATVETYLLSHLKSGEMIMTLGAGNITELSYRLVGKLEGAQPPVNPAAQVESKIVYAPVHRIHQDRKVV